MKERIFLTQITKDVKNTVKDCLLNIIYTKRDLIGFLTECGSTSSDMKGIEEFLTKSAIVDTYYSNLEKRSDKGTMQYHSLIRHILDWSDFSSYWFEQGKLNAGIAKEKIEKLKEILGNKTKKEEEKHQSKEREKESEKIKAKNRTIGELRLEFYEMCKKTEGSQARGYQLETFLQKLFGLYDMDVFKPFKLEGEQIDGSIKFDGNNYTFEAKWQDRQMASDALYHFAYKIESNMLYPRGIFFSISGYSEEAVNKIVKGKNPQLVLFDAVDFIAILEERILITKLLEEKVRYAQTRSRIYVNASEIIINV